MKKLSNVTLMFLVLFLNVPYVFSIHYCKDFLEPGNVGGWDSSTKTWDEELSLEVGEEAYVDVWLNDCPQNLLTAGFLIEYTPAFVSIVGVDAYDGNDLPGPWTGDYTHKFPDVVGPGSYWILLSSAVSGVSPVPSIPSPPPEQPTNKSVKNTNIENL